MWKTNPWASITDDFSKTRLIIAAFITGRLEVKCTKLTTAVNTSSEENRSKHQDQAAGNRCIYKWTFDHQKFHSLLFRAISQSEKYDAEVDKVKGQKLVGLFDQNKYIGFNAALCNQNWLVGRDRKINVVRNVSKQHDNWITSNRPHHHQFESQWLGYPTALNISWIRKKSATIASQRQIYRSSRKIMHLKNRSRRERSNEDLSVIFQTIQTFPRFVNHFLPMHALKWDFYGKDASFSQVDRRF